MFGGLEKFKVGHFSATEGEKKKNPDIVRKMAAANEAVQKRAAAQAREKLRRDLEQSPEEEQEKDIEKLVAV